MPYYARLIEIRRDILIDVGPWFVRSILRRYTVEALLQIFPMHLHAATLPELAGVFPQLLPQVWREQQGRENGTAKLCKHHEQSSKTN